MEYYEKILKGTKGTSHITSIPIEEFRDITALEIFVQKMNQNGVGVTIHHERSNFHQGVLVQIYDKETCMVKNYL